MSQSAGFIPECSLTVLVGDIEVMRVLVMWCPYLLSQDLYLYYFLLVYPGRTLVFVNSIDCLQRVRSLLELLQFQPLPLHARMQQRQRLKNLERSVAIQ